MKSAKSRNLSGETTIKLADGLSYFYFFTERWFGKDWREVYLVLHEDSTLTWYSERGESSPEGGLLLKDAPEMIAAGQVFVLFLLYSQ